MTMNNQPAPPQAASLRLQVIVFVLIWLGGALFLGFIQLVGMGLAAWGASDNGSYGTAGYQNATNAAIALYVLTQLGALIGGIVMLWRRAEMRWIILMVFALYVVWFLGVVALTV